MKSKLLFDMFNIPEFVPLVASVFQFVLNAVLSTKFLRLPSHLGAVLPVLCQAVGSGFQLWGILDPVAKRSAIPVIAFCIRRFGMFVSLLWLIMDNTLRIGTGIPYGRDRRFVMPAIFGMVFSVAGVVLGVIFHTRSWIPLWPLDQIELLGFSVFLFSRACFTRSEYMGPCEYLIATSVAAASLDARMSSMIFQGLDPSMQN